MPLTYTNNELMEGEITKRNPVRVVTKIKCIEIILGGYMTLCVCVDLYE